MLNDDASAGYTAAKSKYRKLTATEQRIPNFDEEDWTKGFLFQSDAGRLEINFERCCAPACSCINLLSDVDKLMSEEENEKSARSYQCMCLINPSVVLHIVRITYYYVGDYYFVHRF